MATGMVRGSANSLILIEASLANLCQQPLSTTTDYRTKVANFGTARLPALAPLLPLYRSPLVMNNCQLSEYIMGRFCAVLFWQRRQSRRACCRTEAPRQPQAVQCRTRSPEAR